MERAEDDELLALADQQGRVVVSGDTDFGALLALTRGGSSSVILFRARSLPHADRQAAIMLRYLGDLADDLDAGAVIVVTDDRITDPVSGAVAQREA